MVFPLAIVALAGPVRWLWEQGRAPGQSGLGLLCLMLVWEHARVYPHHLASSTRWPAALRPGTSTWSIRISIGGRICPLFPVG